MTSFDGSLILACFDGLFACQLYRLMLSMLALHITCHISRTGSGLPIQCNLHDISKLHKITLAFRRDVHIISFI